MSDANNTPPTVTGLAGVSAATGVGVSTLHKTAKELAARGLLVKVNGSWIAEASSAQQIADAAKAIRRASGK